MFKSLTLHGFLSFGPGPTTIPLQRLNILIGANGTGKSNLVEALAVLRAVPKDLPLPIRQGGGARDWLWKGPPEAKQASIEVIHEEGLVDGYPNQELRYKLVFGVEGSSFAVFDERIENADKPLQKPKPYFYFGYEHGRPMLNVKGEERSLKREDIDPTQSILSQRRDPEQYPELTGLAARLGSIRCYRNWPFGPESPLRNSCKAEAPTATLSEDFDNLPARLSVLKKEPAVKRQILKYLGELAPGFEDIEVTPEGGQLQLYLIEGDRSIAARRLSDGTLRYLCLLAILIDPQPPALIVIEEPELGIHPDLMPILRDLMINASERCQLVVTTHSPVFLDAFTQHAENVLVFEKSDFGTEVSMLSPATIDDREVGLGQRWMRGELGGTRW